MTGKQGNRFPVTIKVYAIDWSKIHKDLGWEPKYDFSSWLEETIQWYKDNRQWWENVKNGVYEAYYKKQYKER